MRGVGAPQDDVDLAEEPQQQRLLHREIIDAVKLQIVHPLAEDAAPPRHALARHAV